LDPQEVVAERHQIFMNDGGASFTKRDGAERRRDSRCDPEHRQQRAQRVTEQGS